MKNPLAALFSPSKDDSPEAVLEGNLDEIPEEDKDRLETLTEGMVEDVGEDD